VATVAYLYFFTDVREKVKNMDDLYVLLFRKLRLIDRASSSSSVVAAASDAGTVAEARAVGRRLKARLKIYITLWQIVSLLPFALDMSLPNAYSLIESALSVFNLNVSTSSLVACSAGGGYDAIDALFVNTIYPIVVVLFLKVAMTAHTYAKSNLDPVEMSQLTARYFNVFLVFTYLILPFTSVQIFQTFSCQDVDPDDVDSGDDRYMTVDYSVSCSSSKYELGFVWAIASILVYPVGIPTYYFYILYTARHDIMSRGTSAASAAEFQSRNMRLNPLRLLFEYYQPELWYWEVVETLNRLFLTGVLVVIAQGSAVQIIVGAVTSLFFLKLCDMYQPFIDARVQGLKETSQWQIFFVFFLALLLKSDFQSVHVAALDTLFILAVTANFIIDILQAVWLKYSDRRSPSDSVLELGTLKLSSMDSESRGRTTNNPLSAPACEELVNEESIGVSMSSISSQGTS